MSDFYEGVCVGALGMLALSFATMTALYVTALLGDTRPRQDRLE